MALSDALREVALIPSAFITASVIGSLNNCSTVISSQRFDMSFPFHKLAPLAVALDANEFKSLSPDLDLAAGAVSLS
jgi:hypothetical protein